MNSSICHTMRTGHSNLNSHFKRIGIKASSLCLCREVDMTTLPAIFFTLQTKTTKDKVWLLKASVNVKFWGHARLWSSRLARDRGYITYKTHSLERRRRNSDMRIFSSL